MKITLKRDGYEAGTVRFSDQTSRRALRINLALASLGFDVAPTFKVQQPFQLPEFLPPLSCKVELTDIGKRQLKYPQQITDCIVRLGPAASGRLFVGVDLRATGRSHEHILEAEFDYEAELKAAPLIASALKLLLGHARPDMPPVDEPVAIGLCVFKLLADGTRQIGVEDFDVGSWYCDLTDDGVNGVKIEDEVMLAGYLLGFAQHEINATAAGAKETK